MQYSLQCSTTRKEIKTMNFSNVIQVVCIVVEAIDSGRYFMYCALNTDNEKL